MLKSIDEAPDDLAYEIKRYDDWDWDEAASISWLESGWRWDELNDTVKTSGRRCGEVIKVIDEIPVTAEISCSYFQLNSCDYPGTPIWFFFNTKQNVGTAHALWNERGWEPWFFSARELGLL